MDTVPFDLPGCRLDAVQPSDERLLILAHAVGDSAAYPDCGARSRRVHSYYTRSPADLPVSDRAVHLRLRLRRFRCTTDACPKRTFAEPVPGLIAPRARRTRRLEAVQQRVGFVAGAGTASRLLTLLRMPASPDVLLRLIHRYPMPEVIAPRVLGVDDWAWRRGRAWGTLLVDLERRRPMAPPLQPQPGPCPLPHERPRSLAQAVRCKRPPQPLYSPPRVAPRERSCGTQVGGRGGTRVPPRGRRGRDGVAALVLLCPCGPGEALRGSRPLARHVYAVWGRPHREIRARAHSGLWSGAGGAGGAVA
jgi:hypothetical protein